MLILFRSSVRSPTSAFPLRSYLPSSTGLIVLVSHSCLYPVIASFLHRLEHWCSGPISRWLEVLPLTTSIPRPNRVSHLSPAERARSPDSLASHFRLPTSVTSCGRRRCKWMVLWRKAYQAPVSLGHSLCHAFPCLATLSSAHQGGAGLPHCSATALHVPTNCLWPHSVSKLMLTLPPFRLLPFLPIRTRLYLPTCPSNPGIISWILRVSPALLETSPVSVERVCLGIHSHSPLETPESSQSLPHHQTTRAEGPAWSPANS